MVDDRRRLEPDLPAAAAKALDQHGFLARQEREADPAEIFRKALGQQFGAEGHVGAERPLRARARLVRVRAEACDPRELQQTVGEPGGPLVREDGLERPADAADLRVGGEWRDDPAGPVRPRGCVVVDERDDLAVRFGCSAVARSREAGLVLAHVAEAEALDEVVAGDIRG